MTATEETGTVPDSKGKIAPESGEGKQDTLAKRIRSHPWFKKALIVLIVIIALAGILLERLTEQDICRECPDYRSGDLAYSRYFGCYQ